MKQLHTTCPITKTIRLLSDMRTMLIARALLEKRKHFCELERALPGISTRTLSAKLRKLEEEGIIRKSADGSYEVTEKGKGLRMVERAMKKYGEQFL